MSVTTSSIDDFTKRAVRAWWADGLWDFAEAGFFLLLGYYMYTLARIDQFPSWTWPWPVTMDFVQTPPMPKSIIAFVIGGAAFMGLYIWGVFQLVKALKNRWIAPRTGEVRHRFWMPLTKRVWILYLLVTFGGWFGLIALSRFLLGGERMHSLILAIAPASIMMLIGLEYDLARYRWAAAIGFIACLVVEFFFTTNAVYMEAPRNFFDVSAFLGNPLIPAIIWAVAFLIIGTMAFSHTMQVPYEQQS